jgi:CHAT domain-containing protein/tetratricopeptide (TPR) repeat protein
MRERGQYCHAIKTARELSDLYLQYYGESSLNYIMSLNQLASLHGHVGEFKYAEEVLFKALSINKKMVGVDHPQSAGIMSNLAGLYYQKGDSLGAESLLTEASEILYKTLKDDSANKEDRAWALYYLPQNLNYTGLIYKEQGNYLKAEQDLLSACKIFEDFGIQEDVTYATFVGNLALVYDEMGNYSRALDLLFKSHKIWMSSGHNKDDQHAANLNRLANVYSKLFQFREAEIALMQAREILIQTVGKLHPEYAYGLEVSVNMYFRMGNYSKASSALAEAQEIRLATMKDSPEYAANLISMAELNRINGNFDAAESCLLEAKASLFKSSQIGNPLFIVLLINQAALYFDKDNFDVAESCLVEAKSILESSGWSLPASIPILHNLAFVYKERRLYKEAEALFLKVEDILRSSKREESPEFVQARINLAIIYVITNRISEAMNLLEQVVGIDDRIMERVFFAASENTRLAFLRHERALLGIFLSLVRLHFSGSSARIQKAFELTLRRKGLSAYVSIAQREAILAHKYPPHIDRLKQLQNLRRDIAQVIISGPAAKESSYDYHIRLERMESQQEDLERELATIIRDVNFEKIVLAANKNNIHSALPPDSALIEIVQFDIFDFSELKANKSKWRSPVYMAFILRSDNPHDVRMVEIGEANTIDRMIAAFITEITHRRDINKIKLSHPEFMNSTHDIFDKGYELRKVLFDTLEPSLYGCKTLFMALDGELSRLPFEVLPLEGSNYIIDRYKIIYLSSGRDLLLFSSSKREQAADPVIAVDPDFDLAEVNVAKPIAKFQMDEEKEFSFIGNERSKFELSPLPNTRIEGELIADMLGTTPLVGDQVIESKIKGYKSPIILHIATHGFFFANQKQEPIGTNELRNSITGLIDPERSRTIDLSFWKKLENPLLRSGLALAGANTSAQCDTLPKEAEDGILTAQDVTGIDLTNTELVVLSACDTGLGDVLIGEGVFGLRRSFMLAGAKTLVMSLWKVPDKQTRELMVDFYSHLLKGKPRAEALREAQLEIKKKYPHPLYWGAFICQGNPGRISMPN